VQAPTLPSGNVPVTVIANCGAAAQVSSSAQTVTARPAAPEFFYLTGLGLTDPAFPPGTLAGQAASVAEPVSVSLNGTPLSPGDVLYAGAAPGFAGLYQVNIRIPGSTPAGNLPITLSIGGTTTPADAFLAIQP